ncbi:NDP-sugar epimerase, includes UDP-GlcNAc-inverting 4,6-dehydratase FlaA1 and capsular polysaccharide biosynthesis protein EpsC [Geoalkalibacter ferrihydriticus]|uniref:NDP-sugar epimerase, includes UDP-GlcNAc-inverting 4,6-dehydratase FlaA1 and capsular polysaccharide biosynthesis protein EpsC n=1 Tax=Geoalkalibacter ferrihydriticus TaxID=392333 RepID=A0A1G9X7U1_9BACT|nr:nucleoside-diphosphate sugar epimerase/dehydratase [Geoalkalibacter ferrihydriticus]SDM92804.1 NDP-sugar epimerase, includes UDP-GlcNAc-inverting 4,6-dehydratase FlaA1 and capsular polysaccharide biosynthesis protein EpsC [Geoalkalibacter ferrihydriticus]
MKSSLVLSKRSWIIFGLKTVIIASAFFLAFLLRFDFQIPGAQWRIFLEMVLPVLLIKHAIFWGFGLSHGWWRYVSLADVFDVFKANLAASLAVVLYVVFVHGVAGVPRSVLILDGVFCFLFSCGVRFLTRAFRENYFPRLRARSLNQKRVLIVGAGQAGQMLVREIRSNPDIDKTVAGFVDDDAEKQGRRFQGFKVLGGQERLAELCAREKIDEVIIAIPSATGKQLRKIVERCQGAGVAFKTLPGVGDLIEGRVTIQQVRPVDVEDLLGRDMVRIEVDRIKAFLGGKRVLVTGAAGSIGSEICRQVARFGPAKLVLFDNAESPLFYVEKELGEAFPDIPVAAIIGDVRYRARVEAIFDEFQPQVVFHAAAYKHVPMMEHNPAEAANNNVRGTKIIADAAHVFKAESFVMISTDKAVNPTNIMGATKRAAELYVQDLSRRSKTQYVTVRFGNVLGSAGSVVPIFKSQIAAGGPIKVTHPEVTRFFMTIPEATQLVLQAGSMGKGGEIFLLDMGEPVKILNLAEQLIRLSGMRPYEDVEIVFTGLRPGEKLYEELLLAGEGIMPTAHEKIRVARAAFCEPQILARQIEELYQAERAMDMERVRALLRTIVPEYQPPEPGNPAYEQLFVEPDRRQNQEGVVIRLADRRHRRGRVAGEKAG